MTTILLLIHVWAFPGMPQPPLLNPRPYVAETYRVEAHVPGYWPDQDVDSRNPCNDLAQAVLRELQYGSDTMPALLPGSTATISFNAHCATET
jgi:hypothetical protein